MKYVYLKMKIRNGEYEYESHSVRQLPKKTDIELFAKNYGSDFYGGKAEAADGGYYFHGGAVFVRDSVVSEITKKEYEVLNKFLN